MKTISLFVLLATFLVLSGRADENRDPFWPIGYQPIDKTPIQEEETSLLNFDDLSPEEQALIRAHMDVSGILRQSGFFVAFINGMVVKEGDVVPLNVGSKNYNFRIREISDNTINLEPIRDKNVNEKPKPTTGEIK